MTKCFVISKDGGTTICNDYTLCRIYLKNLVAARNPDGLAIENQEGWVTNVKEAMLLSCEESVRNTIALLPPDRYIVETIYINYQLL